MNSDSITVSAVGEAEREKAIAFSSCTSIPYSDENGDGLTLLFSAGGRSLVGYGMSYHGDFTSMARRVLGGHLQHEMLAKAAKTKSILEHPKAIDATAGMGEDSFILAACGYEVTMLEKDPVIAALLADALRRAEGDPDIGEIVSRMHFVEDDSIGYLRSLAEPPELVYLDPMFPERKKSGLIGKKLQLIQKLECPCSDESELLDAALSAHPAKIIIKRPLKGAYLAGKVPGYSIKGKAIRYDCTVLPK